MKTRIFKVIATILVACMVFSGHSLAFARHYPPPPPSPPRGDWHHDRGHRWSKGDTVVASVLGIGILAALLSGKKNKDRNNSYYSSRFTSEEIAIIEELNKVPRGTMRYIQCSNGEKRMVEKILQRMSNEFFRMNSFYFQGHDFIIFMRFSQPYGYNNYSSEHYWQFVAHQLINNCDSDKFYVDYNTTLYKYLRQLCYASRYDCYVQSGEIIIEK